MRNITRIITLICLLSFSFSLYSQSSIEVRGNKYYGRGEYFVALEYYQQAIDDGIDISDETKIKMGVCYYHLNDIDQAFNYLFEFYEYGKLKGDDLFVFANVAHKYGFYEGAITYYEESKQQGANPIVVDELIASCKWAMANDISNADVRVNPSPLFTSGQSFGIAYYEDGVVYSSANEDGSNKNVDKQGRSFLNLYKSNLDKEGNILEGKEVFSENLVSPYHIGAIAFTSDFQTLYYTKVVRVKGGRSLLKIFTVKYDGSDWVDEKELSINGDEYDCAHPAVSPDDKTLYFTSNKSGGFGGKDLYSAEIKANGDCGAIKNLGKGINTYGDELYPVVSKDNILYFSSDGHAGFGGWDIFKATLKGAVWGDVENMMKPYNSNKDDFSYVIEPDVPSRGFISSNRFGDGKNDVIFYVRISSKEVTTQIEPKDDVIVSGMEFLTQPEPDPVIGTELILSEDTVVEELPVIDEPIVEKINFPTKLETKIKSTFNGSVISDVNVSITDVTTGNIVVQGKSDAAGEISLIIPDVYKKENQEFELNISKGKEFNSKRMIINIMDIEDLNNNGISLIPIFNDNVLDDISGMVIPYRGNKITPEGEKILDQLAAYLLNNPNIVVKLNGHTEARGNKMQNLDVSQTVSGSAEEYLLTKGVQDKNVIPRGYGERYLSNKCKRGVLCEESQHLKNRRIEVVVWKVLK